MPAAANFFFKVLKHLCLDGAALGGDRLAGQRVEGREAVRVAIQGQEHRPDFGVVDEVERLLALLVVDHRRQDDVGLAGAEGWDDAVEHDVVELEVQTELGRERLAEVVVEAGGLAAARR